MQTIMRNTFKLTAALLLVTALFSVGLAPVQAACGSLCTPTLTFDLWAKTGTATLYGSTTVTIWGYAANETDPAGITWSHARRPTGHVRGSHAAQLTEREHGPALPGPVHDPGYDRCSPWRQLSIYLFCRTIPAPIFMKPV